MYAMVRTYQITMGRACYKCTLGFSSTSNVTDTGFSRSKTEDIHTCNQQERRWIISPRRGPFPDPGTSLPAPLSYCDLSENQAFYPTARYQIIRFAFISSDWAAGAARAAAGAVRAQRPLALPKWLQLTTRLISPTRMSDRARREKISTACWHIAWELTSNLGVNHAASNTCGFSMQLQVVHTLSLGLVSFIMKRQ